jgi:catechol 2,3-dioxygenase
LIVPSKELLAVSADLRVRSLGHVVLRVRDLERSLGFYRDFLGMREAARFRGVMVFLTFGNGNHHDLALMQIGMQAPAPHPAAVGLYHVAFKVGDSLDDLRQWRHRIEQTGVDFVGQADHRVSQALYVRDPDGIEIELYVDADPALWRDHPEAVATIDPLKF